MPAADPIALDPYVVDVLLPDLVGHDRHPSAFVVYLALWRHTAGGRAPAQLSLRELAEATGLSKRAVQDAVDALVRRKLVTLDRATPTSVPSYYLLRPWARRA
jgi:hypothetical protein